MNEYWQMAILTKHIMLNIQFWVLHYPSVLDGTQHRKCTSFRFACVYRVRLNPMVKHHHPYETAILQVYTPFTNTPSWRKWQNTRTHKDLWNREDGFGPQAWCHCQWSWGRQPRHTLSNIEVAEAKSHQQTQQQPWWSWRTRYTHRHLYAELCLRLIPSPVVNPTARWKKLSSGMFEYTLPISSAQ